MFPFTEAGLDGLTLPVAAADNTVATHPQLIIEEQGPTALLLPAPSQVSYFVRLPNAASLVFEVASGSAIAAQLSIRAARDRGEARVVWTHDGSPTTARIDLGGFSGEIVRLDFDVSGSGELRLSRPRITGRAKKSDGQEPLVYPRAARPNVLLYVVDSLRADHLGCYGYPLPTSPNIDALASESLVFARAVAQAPWTLPATAAILTGRYPYAHGALRPGDRIRSDVPMLAELLRAQGYSTAAFVTNRNVDGAFGFDRGFDEFTYAREDPSRLSLHLGADGLNDLVFPWLDGHAAKPFLLYLHASDPQAPYTASPDAAAPFRPADLAASLAAEKQPLQRAEEDPTLATEDNLAYLRSLYDAEVAFVDDHFGKLVAELKRRGLYEHTLIILVADHGEELHEHGGFEHGHTLYAEQLAVPLIVRLPVAPESAKRVTCLARQIDVLPTILEVLGVTGPRSLPGQSLLQLRDGTCADDESFAQTSLDEGTAMAALFTNGWKVIVTEQSGDTPPRVEVYDHWQDPRDEYDVSEKQPLVRGYAQQALRKWMTEGGAGRGGPRPTLGR